RELARLRGGLLPRLTLAGVESLERDLKTFLAATTKHKEKIIKEQLERASQNKSDEQNQCVICQENAKSILILPCR
ncbi:unnamed protein product, partial [Heterosigma akashiwo]